MDTTNFNTSSLKSNNNSDFASLEECCAFLIDENKSTEDHSTSVHFNNEEDDFKSCSNLISDYATDEKVNNEQTNQNNKVHKNNQKCISYLKNLLDEHRRIQTIRPYFNYSCFLLEKEIDRIRNEAFSSTKKFSIELNDLPKPEGQTRALLRKVFVPVEDFPNYNFVGRLLGPGGSTAKQLEKELGCKIMIRGTGSMRDKKMEEQNRDKPNWQHLNEPLHVLVCVEDTENRIEQRANRIVEMIQKFFEEAVLTPENEDTLRKLQLVELTYKNAFNVCNPYMYASDFWYDLSMYLNAYGSSDFSTNENAATSTTKNAATALMNPVSGTDSSGNSTLKVGIGNGLSGESINPNNSHSNFAKHGPKQPQQASNFTPNHKHNNNNNNGNNLTNFGYKSANISNRFNMDMANQRAQINNYFQCLQSLMLTQPWTYVYPQYTPANGQFYSLFPTNVDAQHSSNTSALQNFRPVNNINIGAAENEPSSCNLFNSK